MTVFLEKRHERQKSHTTHSQRTQKCPVIAGHFCLRYFLTNSTNGNKGISRTTNLVLIVFLRLKAGASLTNRADTACTLTDVRGITVIGQAADAADIRI